MCLEWKEGTEYISSLESGQNAHILWFPRHSPGRQEMLKFYPDAEATMGASRIVGDYGPDAAGKHLTLTTLKVRFGGKHNIHWQRCSHENCYTGIHHRAHVSS